jgi:hypothetical protein
VIFVFFPSFLDLSNDPLERKRRSHVFSFEGYSDDGNTFPFLFAFLVPENGRGSRKLAIIQWPFKSIINDWTKEEK